MQWYHWALAIWALGTAILAGRTGLRRGMLWVSVLSLDFILSVGYLYMPKPDGPGVFWIPPSAFSAFIDASVCVAIWYHMRRLWEGALYIVVMLMAITNIAYTGATLLSSSYDFWETVGFWYAWNVTVPPSFREGYGIALEVLNYVALLIIGGTAWLEGRKERDSVERNPHGGLFGSALRHARDALQRPYEPAASIRHGHKT